MRQCCPFILSDHGHMATLGPLPPCVCVCVCVCVLLLLGKIFGAWDMCVLCVQYPISSGHLLRYDRSAQGSSSHEQMNSVALWFPTFAGWGILCGVQHPIISLRRVSRPSACVSPPVPDSVGNDLQPRAQCGQARDALIGQLLRRADRKVLQAPSMPGLHANPPCPPPALPQAAFH